MKCLLRGVMMYSPISEQDDLLFIVLIILQGFSEEINFVSTAGISHNVTAFPGLAQTKDIQFIAKSVDLDRPQVPSKTIRLVGSNGKYQDI